MHYTISSFSKEHYPTGLAEIPDIPEKLYLQGSPLEKDALYLSVIGSRKYTAYGEEVCKKLIEGLKGYPIVIVSGLALGIDSIAHKAAMNAELKTIAVPGSGLSEDVLYPRSNVPLARDILSKGGTLLSEYAPNFRATRWSFPRRNRIMAGIAHATLVIEATEKSGSLITARLALDYNRDVLAVPGPITSENTHGTNLLIKQGAVPVTTSEDILEAFRLL